MWPEWVQYVPEALGGLILAVGLIVVFTRIVAVVWYREKARHTLRILNKLKGTD